MEAKDRREIDRPNERLAVERSFHLGDWIVDPASNRLRKADGEVRLEPKVMRVLLLLAERHGRVVSRRELEEKIWPRVIVSDDAVTNTLIKLRKALGDDARRPRYIETIAKSGYRLFANVTPLAIDKVGPESAAAARNTGLAHRQSPAAPTASDDSAPSLRRRLFLAVAVSLVALMIGWLAWRTPRDSQVEGPVLTPGRPVVAVLPFENLTADTEQDYFAGGVTEDLITDLSKLSGLQVVARNSVFAYQGSVETESKIGRELGARYLVKGSVQRAGGRLRINVRLTDAIAGRNRWAERYDRGIADIFQVQDEIAARVVSALQVELAPGELQRLTRSYATNVEAYDQYLRGLDLLGRRASADNPQARSYFQRAIELEPGFARAYAGLAMTYALHAVYGAGPAVVQSLTRAEEVARQGLEIDDSLPQLRYALGLLEMYKGNLTAAIAEVSRAIELRPSYADGYGLLAWILHFAGRPEEGLEAMQQAIALNPHATALYRTVKGALHYELGELEQALRLLQESVAMSPDQLLTRLFLAAVYAATGDLEAARWEAEEVRALDPDFTLDLDYGFPIRDPRYRARFLTDLQRAGLSEP
jgi:TolB-like protein/DNA-binding winged helix-turn-helix (wHTH) protein/Tfp pilus assembly protein PilF